MSLLNPESKDTCPQNLTVTTCEMHTCGEPLRIVESGVPEIEGTTIFEKISFLRNNHDYIRKFLMFEPRGHNDMYGTMRVDPDLPEAHAAFIFMHNEGYSTMCGHAIIALGRYCVDKGIVNAQAPETLVNIQCPCGLVPTYVSVNNGVTGAVRFHSVPSFTTELDVQVDVPGIGKLRLDVAYGGAFYGFLPAEQLGIDLKQAPIAKIAEMGEKVTEATKKKIQLNHPDSAELSFLYGTVIIDKTDVQTHGLIRQVTIFGDCAVDRSPTGSATSAHVALLCSKGELGIGSEKIFESAVNGTRFSAKAIRSARCGSFEGVIVEVSGRAFYTGENKFTMDPEDSLKAGFRVKLY